MLLAERINIAVARYSRESISRQVCTRLLSKRFDTYRKLFDESEHPRADAGDAGPDQGTSGNGDTGKSRGGLNLTEQFNAEFRKLSA